MHLFAVVSLWLTEPLFILIYPDNPGHPARISTFWFWLRFHDNGVRQFIPDSLPIFPEGPEPEGLEEQAGKTGHERMM